MLEADPCRLEQILSNLLVNAAKYTDPGGEISFGVTRENGDVIVSREGQRDRHRPRFACRTSSILFAQANRSLHRAEGGLGIGLTIVRGLTELHGGRVWATSEGFGRGAEFVVCLPARTAASKQERPELLAICRNRFATAPNSGRRRPTGTIQGHGSVAEEAGARGTGRQRRSRSSHGSPRIRAGHCAA